MRVLVVEDEASLSQQLSAALAVRAMQWTARPTASAPTFSREQKATTRWCSTSGFLVSMA